MTAGKKVLSPRKKTDVLKFTRRKSSIVRTTNENVTPACGLLPVISFAIRYKGIGLTS
jgi:hypothetical protein